MINTKRCNYCKRECEFMRLQCPGCGSCDFKFPQEFTGVSCYTVPHYSSAYVTQTTTWPPDQFNPHGHKLTTRKM